MRKPSPEFNKTRLAKDTYEAYERPPDAYAYPNAPIAEIARDLGTEIKVRFQQALHRASEEEPSVSPRMKEHLLSKDFDVPSVKIIEDRKQIETCLRNLSYTSEASSIQPNQVLMILNLPKPIALFF